MIAKKSTTRQPAADSSGRFVAFSHPVQLAMAFVLGVAFALLIARACHIISPRPSERERIVVATPIELNSATKAELLQLPGVGDRTADKILATRNANGGFGGTEGLRDVKGMGPSRFEKVKPWVRVDGDDQAIAAATTGTKISETPRAGTTKKILPADMVIDVNHASAMDLQKLPGIGAVLAQRIIVEREKAPFQKPDDLRRVTGIGPKTLEKLRPHIICDGPAGADDTSISRP